MKTVLTAALLTATALTGSAALAQAEIRNADQLDETQNIVENASKVSNFSTLVAAVQAAGLADDLMGEGPFTVFAPTDAAFAALPEGTVETLLMPENRQQLEDLLSAHVVPGLYTSDEIDRLLAASDDDVSQGVTVDSEMQMVTFETLDLSDISVDKVGDSFYVTGALTADDNAEIIAADIMTSNGVIHVINKVITPES